MDTLLHILTKYHSAFLSGLFVTLKLALIIWSSGLLIGAVIGVLSVRLKSIVGIPARLCSFLLSGIPILAYLFWAHYPMQVILNVVIDPFITAAVVLSSINIFAVADLIRSQLSDFPEQYVIAARVCGLSPRQTILKIQFPIILRQVIPALLQLQILMLQSTLFASLISVNEIFRVAQRINSIEYKPVEIYTALAIFFLLISLPVNGLAIVLKKRFTRNISEA